MEKEDQDKIDFENLGHPKGTLAILVIYGLLFGAGWLLLYFCEFLPRGAPHP